MPHTAPNLPDATITVAPMMAWTDRHCRTLHRLFAPRALLFTEMVTAHALLFGDPEKLLRHSADEHPVALQLGGSDPDALAQACRLGAAAGFDEINLNVGCPSDRVQRGRFGACLMLEPQLVADCVIAMQEASPVPVTVKCRLGVDDQDSDALLHQFIAPLAAAGMPRLYLHARKAILKGLSPAQNRHIPPLQYDRVYTAQSAFPQLPIIINGGIASVSQVQAQLQRVPGVMLGRAAYQNPGLLYDLEQALYGVDQTPTTAGTDVKSQIVGQYRAYAARELAAGTRLGDLCRPLLGIFHAVPGARIYRRILSDSSRLKANRIELLDDALAALTVQAA
ncbi:MAG: tRNA dihydrouridine(20/20a) synthase DusA [Pseudomonadales bacterium]